MLKRVCISNNRLSICILTLLLSLAVTDLGAQSTVERFLHGGIGRGALVQVDHTLSPLHYSGGLRPLYLSYHTTAPRRRQSWTVFLQRADPSSGTENDRSFQNLLLEYRHLRILAAPTSNDWNLRIYGGGGLSTQFTLLEQTIVHPTYVSTENSGYVTFSLDMELSVTADPLPRIGLLYGLDLPVLAYLVRPNFARQWPGLDQGKLVTPSTWLQVKQRLECLYDLGGGVQAGLEGFYTLSNMNKTWEYGASEKGLLLTMRINL